MAVVKNKTDKVLALFRPDAPPVHPGTPHEAPDGTKCACGGEVTLRDEVFAERAWPKSTWDLVEPPGGGYIDASPEDAWLYQPKPEKPAAKNSAAKKSEE